MRILINGLTLCGRFTGVQYYTENLINNLASEVADDLKIDVLVSGSYKGNSNSTNFVKSVHFDSASRLKRILFENRKLSKLYKKWDYDILHSPAYILPYNWNLPGIITVHDTISLDYPEYCSTLNMINFNLNLKRSVRKAEKVIAVSECVKRDIIRTCKVNPEKIEVIYNGINPNFREVTDARELNSVKVKYGLPDNYILFVGNIEPKKNLERLLLAFDLLAGKKEIPHYLVIVGQKGWKYKKFFETLSKIKFSDKVILTGYVNEEELRSIYTMADVFVFPSLYEGFGYPVLEAMSCGTPVVASDSGALPEVTGGNCLFVDPYSIEEIASAIGSLVLEESLRKQLISSGLRHVQDFTLKKSVTNTLNLYRSLS